MDALTALLLEEEARLAVARRKVADLEHRIAVLRQMQQKDDLDSALDVQVSRSSESVRTDGLSTNAAGPRQRNVKGSLGRIVLEAMADRSVVSLDDVEKHVASASAVGASRAHLRTVLMNLRVRHGYVANPAAGQYQLTELGRRALSDAQSETAPASTEAASESTTPAGEAEDSEL